MASSTKSVVRPSEANGELSSKGRRSGHGGARRPAGTCKTVKSSASLSDLFLKIILDDDGNKENGLRRTAKDFQNKPDLWMAAFDNPLEFIEYCRKRLERVRRLVEQSRVVETQIVQQLEKLTENTSRSNYLLDDLVEVQGINDKLQEVVMEERTHCQHLVGINDQLQSELTAMSRKFEAALVMGKVSEESIEHLLERDPFVVSAGDRIRKVKDKITKMTAPNLRANPVSGSSTSRAGRPDPVVLSEKVIRLEAHIAALKKQHREEVTVLKDNIKNTDIKVEAVKKQYQDLLKSNGDTILELKGCLSNLAAENLHLRQELLVKDDKFLQTQVDELQFQNATRIRPTQRPKSRDVIEQAFHECNQIEKDLKVRLANTEIELCEKANTLRDAMAKVIELERKSSSLERDVDFMQSSHETCMSGMKERNKILEKRCEKLEARRRLDNAGFRQDINQLRGILNLLKRNISKCVTHYKAQTPATATTATSVQSELPPPPTVSDEVLNEILNNSQPPSEASIRRFLRDVEPRKAQIAMEIWTDFLGRKLGQLEGKVNHARNTNSATDSDLVVVLDNRKAMRRHRQSRLGSGGEDTPSLSQSSEEGVPEFDQIGWDDLREFIEQQEYDPDVKLRRLNDRY